MSEVFRGNCKTCECHLPHGEMPEIPHDEMPEVPNRIPRRSNRFLNRKREAEESESEESKSEKSESESESETEEVGEAAPEAEEDQMRKELNKKAYEISKKKWELIEEQELLKLKEEEIDLDSKEMGIEANKMELKKVEKDIKLKEVQLKNMYVKQLNLQSYVDGEDEEVVDAKAREEYDIEMTIESLESEIELLKSRGMGLELMIADARRKIMAGRAKIAKSRDDIKAAKAIREREMKEEEEGKWPGEPRWAI